MTNLIKQIEVICVFSYWEISINDYEMLFDEIIENEKMISLEEKQNELMVRII
jgi:hypothetical protein